MIVLRRTDNGVGKPLLCSNLPFGYPLIVDRISPFTGKKLNHLCMAKINLLGQVFAKISI